MNEPKRRSVEPLRTRHVFLDTEVYRRAGFNISNSSFYILKKYITSGRIVLHITDITLGEIHRQLDDMVLGKATEAKRLARDFDRLSQIIGDSRAIVGRIDASKLASDAWKGFLNTLLTQLRTSHVVAQTVPALAIFERYFNGKPPFQNRGSKEFPDAFVVEALARFCRDNGVTMYVVSGDAALREAAASYNELLPLATLDDVLAAAAADSGADHEALVDGVFADPGFDWRLTAEIEGRLDFIDFGYYGSLPNGKVESPELAEIIGVDGYEVATVDNKTIGLILDVSVVLQATIRYIDEFELRDKDDDVIPTELTASSQAYTHVKLYV